MKIKRNYPRRTMVKFGKCYFDYLRIELDQGKIDRQEFKAIAKLIPYNA